MQLVQGQLGLLGELSSGVFSWSVLSNKEDDVAKIKNVVNYTVCSKFVTCFS